MFYKGSYYTKIKISFYELDSIPLVFNNLQYYTDTILDTW